MKNKILITIIILIIALYIGIKIYTINTYSLNSNQEKKFKEIANSLIIKDLIVTKNDKLESDYIDTDLFQIKKISEDFSCNEEESKLICKENDNTFLTFEIATSLKDKLNKEKYKNIEYKILIKEKISDDINILGYIKEMGNRNLILSSIKNTKRIYFLKRFTLKNLQKIHSIDLIEGKFTGYILHTSSKVREVYINKGSKTYKITFSNLNNRIEEVLNSLKIKD